MGKKKDNVPTQLLLKSKLAKLKLLSFCIRIQRDFIRKSQDVSKIEKNRIGSLPQGRWEQKNIELYPLTVSFVYWNNCTNLLGKIRTHFIKNV